MLIEYFYLIGAKCKLETRHNQRSGHNSPTSNIKTSDNDKLVKSELLSSDDDDNSNIHNNSSPSSSSLGDCSSSYPMDCAEEPLSLVVKRTGDLLTDDTMVFKPESISRPPPATEDFKQEAKIEPSSTPPIKSGGANDIHQETPQHDTEMSRPIASGDAAISSSSSTYRKISLLDYNAFQMLLPMKLMPKIIGARANTKNQHVLDPFKCEKFGCENSSLKVF